LTVKKEERGVSSWMRPHWRSRRT